MQGKIEAYNKIVKNEFISVVQISRIDEGKVRYGMFVKEYNDKREHGGIYGLTPSEMFLQTFNRSLPKPILSKEVSPMWVFENVTYLCKYYN